MTKVERKDRVGEVRCRVGQGQVREPGLPTSHLVPRHSVHHVHLTEEKRWWSWAHDSHGLRDHKGRWGSRFREAYTPVQHNLMEE